MVREGIGSIFKRKDGKYFVYLPNKVAEDSAFPFGFVTPAKVRVRFTEEGSIIVERCES